MSVCIYIYIIITARFLSSNDLYFKMEKLLQLCKDDFVCEFRSLPTHGAYAPGRVNLIGDHVDYNDGFVLPMVIIYTFSFLCVNLKLKQIDR